MACFQVSPSRLFTAAWILKTSEINQKQYTALARTPSVMLNENCMVVAVTALKNVATVLKLRRFWLACS